MRRSATADRGCEVFMLSYYHNWTQVEMAELFQVTELDRPAVGGGEYFDAVLNDDNCDLRRHCEVFSDGPTLPAYLLTFLFQDFTFPYLRRTRHPPDCILQPCGPAFPRKKSLRSPCRSVDPQRVVHTGTVVPLLPPPFLNTHRSLARRDPRLAADQAGRAMYPPAKPGRAHVLTGSIISQQILIKAAASIGRKVKKLCGRRRALAGSKNSPRELRAVRQRSCRCLLSRYFLETGLIRRLKDMPTKRSSRR